MSHEYQVQFVGPKDFGLGLEMIDADTWADALLEVVHLDVPAGTVTIEITQVME